MSFYLYLSARLHKFLIKRNVSQFSYNSLALPPPLRSKDSRQEVSEPTPNFDKLIGRSTSFPILPSLSSLGSHAGYVGVLGPIMMSSEERGSSSCLLRQSGEHAFPEQREEKQTTGGVWNRDPDLVLPCPAQNQ